jgi:glycosyltransferase involved in cell wall biosynthesis
LSPFAADHRVILPYLSRPNPSKSPPAISIITTVYDRVNCLKRCIQSVCSLHFTDYEHIIVADCPPLKVCEQIKTYIENDLRAARRTTLASLSYRRNDWGITPARLGLYLAKGEYVCFLSDDNGYLPHHFDALCGELEKHPEIGFCYSSCLYDSRRVLASPTPTRKHIDLGQPLFRRTLFDDYLGGTIPFNERCWDWAMIRTFIEKGVRFSHVNQATFIFRFARYPHLWPVAIA